MRLASTTTLAGVFLFCGAALMAGACTTTEEDDEATAYEQEELAIEAEVAEVCDGETGQSGSLDLFGKAETDAEKAEAIAGICLRTPFGPGQIKLIGCTAADLNGIAIIPESGTTCTHPPTNGTWYDADGIYIKGSKGWFKVPNHCDAEISCLSDGSMSVSYCCNACASLVGGWPRWTTDPHGAPSPF